MRASDADREQVADRLRKAAAEGRILASELEERLQTALRAKTYGELDSVTVDLPGARVSHAPRPAQARSQTWMALRRQPVATVTILVAVTLVAFVLAALVLAGIVAFSGVWILFAFFWITRGGHRGRRYRHRPYRHMAGRW